MLRGVQPTLDRGDLGVESIGEVSLLKRYRTVGERTGADRTISNGLRPARLDGDFGDGRALRLASDDGIVLCSPSSG